MTDRSAGLVAHGRTALTLLVLALLLVVGIVWGFSSATSPFPSLTSAADGACTTRTVPAGQRLMPAEVTVSVLNAGSRDGAGGTTLDDLTTDGFAPGELGNAPTESRVKAVEIWTTDRTSPAVRLLRGYLGKRVVVRTQDPGVPGLAVVVGDQFSGVVQGQPSVVVRTDTSVCGP